MQDGDLIIMALTAIGLKTDLREMLATGMKPMLLGFIAWLSVAFTSIAIQRIAGQW